MSREEPLRLRPSRLRRREGSLADPMGAMKNADLTDPERAALTNMDRPGLTLAAESFERKREMGPGRSLTGRMRRWLARRRSGRERRVPRPGSLEL